MTGVDLGVGKGVLTWMLVFLSRMESDFSSLPSRPVKVQVGRGILL